MIYNSGSFHTGYRVLKVKWIVDLNFMNKIAFVLNLASSKHCDTSEKMFYYFSVWVFSTASLDKNNKKTPKSNFYNEINTKSSKDQEALKKKKID